MPIGVLYTRDEASYYHSPSEKKTGKVGTILIKEVVVTFENGQIAGLKIKGVVDDSSKNAIIFQNRIPISYSTKADVSSDYYGKKKRKIKLFATDEKFDGDYVLMDEVLYNDYRQNNYSENYSPIDTVLTIRPFEQGKIIFKEKITDIIQARIYTDLLGYGKENPNGLVQAEISKKIFINTQLRQMNRFLLFRTGGYGYLGFFNYIIPSVSITKAEKDNKYFAPPGLSIRIDSLNNDAPVKVGTMDLLKYGSFFSGDEINIAYFGFPKIHSVFHYSIGSDLMLSGVSKTTGVQDSGKVTLFSFSNEFNVASLSFSPLIIKWDLNPHPSYRVYFSYYLTRIEAIDSKVIQIEPINGRWLHQLSFLTAIKFDPEASSELFFRSRISMNTKERKDVFFQAQLGYAFKVFTNKPKFKNRVFFHDTF